MEDWLAYILRKWLCWKMMALACLLPEAWHWTSLCSPSDIALQCAALPLPVWHLTSVCSSSAPWGISHFPAIVPDPDASAQPWSASLSCLCSPCSRIWELFPSSHPGHQSLQCWPCHVLHLPTLEANPGLAHLPTSLFRGLPLGHCGSSYSHVYFRNVHNVCNNQQEYYFLILAISPLDFYWCYCYQTFYALTGVLQIIM